MVALFIFGQHNFMMSLGFQYRTELVEWHFGVEVLIKSLGFQLGATDALFRVPAVLGDCLLYTSDAADE